VKQRKDVKINPPLTGHLNQGYHKVYVSIYEESVEDEVYLPGTRQQVYIWQLQVKK
jgi:hypothetical protein